MHGYALTAGGTDILPQMEALSLTWGLDHRTMTPIPPAGALTVTRASALSRQRIIREGVALAHPALGGTLFAAQYGIQRRDSGGAGQPHMFELETDTRLAMTVRDRRVEWRREQAGAFNRPGIDFRTQPLQQRSWGRQALQAAYPTETVDVSAVPATGLQWYPPRTASWNLQDTGRILHQWFGWPVLARGAGGLVWTPGDLDGTLRSAATAITESSLWISQLRGGVHEAGLYTSLALDWAGLYRDAYHDEVVNDEPVAVPPLQVLYRNAGAERLHEARQAVIPGIPPGSPNPAIWDAAAYGLASTLPYLQMEVWTPSGDYGQAITGRAQHRRVLALELPGVQPDADARAALRTLITPGRVVSLDIDGAPLDSWAGYATVSIVHFEWHFRSLPRWTVSLVSLSGRIAGRDRWILGTTPLPAPLTGEPGPAAWRYDVPAVPGPGPAAWAFRTGGAGPATFSFTTE